jgi:hypothetical protein
LIDLTDKLITRTGHAIVSITIALLHITAIVWFSGTASNIDTIYSAIFASWVANLLFFITVGIIVVFVSISSPEQLPFDRRARIFLSGQEGSHIDYAVRKMRESALYFANSTKISFRIEEYNKDSNIYFVCEEFKTDIYCYVKDISSPYPVKILFTGLTQPPPNRDGATLTFPPTPNGSPPHDRVVADGTGLISAQYDLPFDKNASAQLDYTLHSWWTPKTEPHVRSLNRFTKRIEITIYNGGPKVINMKISKILYNDRINSGEEINLEPGHEVGPLIFNDVEPDVNLFEIHIY